MINIKKYAAVDVGSNAIRLLVMNIVEQEGKETLFTKSSLVRVPIRLGQDVFTVGEISDENIERMIDAMKAYKLLMKIHKVEKYEIFATSAMREAYNAADVVETVEQETGLKINVIGGKKEATIIASTDLKEYIETDKTYLFVDVGGGSTEFTLFNKGEIVGQKSFKIGTVRLLNNLVTDLVWTEVEKWVSAQTEGMKDVALIGSGGNINKLFKMSGQSMGSPLTFEYIKEQYEALGELSFDDRVSLLQLNSDRADVIVHATRIYYSAMQWAKAKEIYVPKIGLADGIVKAMYYGKI